MKKLLLALIVSFSFGSAIAKTDTAVETKDQRALDIQVLEKSNKASFLLDSNRGNPPGVCVIEGNCLVCGSGIIIYCKEK